jgi:hypothetical protein
MYDDPNRTEELRPRRARRPRQMAAIAAGLIAGAVLVAACGSTPSGPGVATAGSSSTAAKSSSAGSGKTGALAYSQCMRSHGLPNFPDPQPISQGGHQGNRIQTPDLSSPQAQTAEKACSKFLPNGGSSNPAQNAQQQAHLLAFARCMRAHGVPSFPDPTSTGSFPSSIARIDRSSPALRSAANTCLPVAAGAISFGTSRGSSH